MLSGSRWPPWRAAPELHNWDLVDGRGVQHGVDGVIIENMHDTPYCLDKDLGKATTMKTVSLHSILTSFPWLDFDFSSRLARCCRA